MVDEYWTINANDSELIGRRADNLKGVIKVYNCCKQ